MRELTWALLPGEELFAAAAPAATLRSESLGSSSVYSKVCRTRITRLRASGTGFQTLRMMGIGESGGRAKSTVTTPCHARPRHATPGQARPGHKKRSVDTDPLSQLAGAVWLI